MRIFTKTLAVSLSILGATGSAQAKDLQSITVAGGCFWCVESDFEQVAGVVSAVSGFAGGKLKDPTYKQVTSGGTGHREAVKITFDADKVKAEQLFDMFFRSVDPTDAGGQFCDRGKSYSTAIYAADGAQTAAAKRSKAAAQAELGQKVVTPILGNATFYEADAYHQDYYKSSKIVITRFGPVKKSKAYKKYRTACGRDARVKQLWGSTAPFAS